MKEAMLNGIPVRTSHRGALPEIVGDDGLVFPMPGCHTPSTTTIALLLSYRAAALAPQPLGDD